MPNPRQKRAIAKKKKAVADSKLTGHEKARRTAEARRSMTPRTGSTNSNSARQRARAKARGKVSKKDTGYLF